MGPNYVLRSTYSSTYIHSKSLFLTGKAECQKIPLAGRFESSSRPGMIRLSKACTSTLCLGLVALCGEAKQACTEYRTLYIHIIMCAK